jgi:hypothetical protein
VTKGGMEVIGLDWAVFSMIDGKTSEIKKKNKVKQVAAVVRINMLV